MVFSFEGSVGTRVEILHSDIIRLICSIIPVVCSAVCILVLLRFHLDFRLVIQLYRLLSYRWIFENNSVCIKSELANVSQFWLHANQFWPILATYTKNRNILVPAQTILYVIQFRVLLPVNYHVHSTEGTFSWLCSRLYRTEFYLHKLIKYYGL